MPGLSLASWEASFPEDVVPATASEAVGRLFSGSCEGGWGMVAVGMCVDRDVLHLSLTYSLQPLALCT